LERKQRGKYLPLSRKIIGVSTIYQRGKTHIPRDVRDILDVYNADKIVWIYEAGKIFVESADKA
jgi:bifunctional DNA-binding transcriptional regulator/antitoxin component of YhaV-PrlF toxin-antitoxin module